MAEKRVNCQIVVPEAIADGAPVNAFRVVRAGGDWLLDFLVLSADQSRALVVSRVRVEPAFLDAVRSRLDDALRVPAGVPARLFPLEVN